MRPTPPVRLPAIVALGAFALALSAASPALAQDQRTLSLAVDNYNAQKYKEAALQFFDVSENSGEDELTWRAEYFLALTLSKMGLHHAALMYDRFIIDQGSEHPYYLKAVENLLEVMDAIGDRQVIPSILDAQYNEKFAELPTDLINRINFLVALWSHQQRKLEDSESFLDAVPVDAKTYPRARYLRGVQVARQAQEAGDEGAEALFTKASALFEEVLKLQNTNNLAYDDLAELKELATIALGRVRFAEGRFEEAMDHYNRIPRFSRQWRDALFESAYAAFQNDDYGKALGYLHTLHSPAAKAQALPESWLLKSYIYYFSCLFEESKAALAELQATYPELGKGIEALLAEKREPDAFYDLLVNGAAGGMTLSPALRNELMADESLRSYRSYITALETEVSRIKAIDEWKQSGLQVALAETLGQNRNLFRATAGRAVQRGIGRIKLDIEMQDGNADIVRFEMAKREKDLLESGYDAETVLARQRMGRPLMPASGAEYWEFDGEVWPDELGYYQYTVKNACPAEKAEQAAR
jgi:tetratricopeptide (TPR) repeat protein